MAKQLEFDWNKRIIEKSLEYDDHNPKHRKELEEYLTRSNQALKTGKVEVKTPVKKSMEQYRELMGNMECLNHVEQELKGLLDKQEQSND